MTAAPCLSAFVKVLFVLQVAVLDLNKTCGEQCKDELDSEFGEGNCTFIQCDVSNGDALRGDERLTSLPACTEPAAASVSPCGSVTPGRVQLLFKFLLMKKRK